MPPVPPPDPPLRDGPTGLRQMREDDAPIVTAYCDDPSIRRWVELPSPYTEAEFREWRRQAEERRLAGEGLELLIVDAEDVPIGGMGLKQLDRPGYAEIGYLLSAPARGRGHATRALRLLRDYAVRQLGRERVELLIHHENEPSRRVARAAGFAETGEYRPCRQGPDPQTADHEVFAWPGAGEA